MCSKVHTTFPSIHPHKLDGIFQRILGKLVFSFLKGLKCFKLCCFFAAGLFTSSARVSRRRTSSLDAPPIVERSAAMAPPTAATQLPPMPPDDQLAAMFDDVLVGPHAFITSWKVLRNKQQPGRQSFRAKFKNYIYIYIYIYIENGLYCRTFCSNSFLGECDTLKI